MTKPPKIEYTAAEVLAELTYRKEQDPLAFFENLPLQQAFDDCPAKFKCLFGGNRSGKTEKGAEYAIKKALAIPNARIWAAAVADNVSKEVQQRKIYNLLPKNAVTYAHYDPVNGFRNEKVIFKNGSIIMFKTYHQGRKKFEGDDVDLIWLDEEPEDKGIVDECLMRLIDRGGELILTMTALMGMTDLLSNIFQDYEIVRSQHASDIDETLPRIAKKGEVYFFFLWTEENPHVNADAVMERFGQIDKRELKSRKYGIPTNLVGKIYPQFNRDIHVIPWSLVPERRMSVYTVVDPHDAKPWAIQWWAIDSMGTKYCVDEYPETPFHEIMGDDKTYDDYAEIIKKKEAKLCKIFDQPHATGRIIDPNFGNKTIKLAVRQQGDSSTTPKNELRKRGLAFRDGVDALREGHMKVRESLSWKAIGNEIVKQPTMFIVNFCTNTIDGLSKYGYRNSETKDGDIKENVGLVEKWKHYPDTTRYFDMSNPQYRDHAMERREQNAQNANQGRVY